MQFMCELNIGSPFWEVVLSTTVVCHTVWYDATGIPSY